MSELLKVAVNLHPSHPPDVIVFVDRTGREVARIVNVAPKEPRDGR